MGQRRQYVVRGSEPAEDFAFVADSEEDLREWLDNPYVVGPVPRIRDSIIEGLRERGEASYNSDNAQDDYELSDSEFDELVEIQFDIYARTIEVTDAEEVLYALHEINLHRARVGQRPLEPIAAGWGPDDVIAEAKRLRTPNPKGYGPVRPSTVPTWVRPPAAAKAIAERALADRANLPKSKRGGLERKEAKREGITSGVERAESIARGDLQPAEDVNAFFQRFKGTHASSQHKAWKDSKVQQAWDLWGGDPMWRAAQDALRRRSNGLKRRLMR